MVTRLRKYITYLFQITLNVGVIFPGLLPQQCILSRLHTHQAAFV